MRIIVYETINLATQTPDGDRFVHTHEDGSILMLHEMYTSHDVCI